MDNSMPGRRDAPDSALVDMLMLEAPVGLALFGPDMRFRWVNAALTRLGRQAGTAPSPPPPPPTSPNPSEVSSPANPDSSSWAGLLPSQAWPEPIATRAENALRQVLAKGAPLAEAGYPVVTAPVGAAPAPAPLSAPAADADQSAEAEIRRSEERYRSLVLGGAQVVWVASPDGAMKEDSPEWRWITGQSPEDFTGFGWLNSVHPEDRERVERDWRECVRTGKVFDDRYRIRTKGGSYRHYDVRAVPIERDGKIVEWVGASTDVTSQREAEEMRGRLTEQLSAAALRTARLQQATSMLAEALTVEQVVEVITEVGRTAIGALRSAVALLEPDGTRLRVVNDDLRNAPDFAGGFQLTLETPSVMT